MQVQVGGRGYIIMCGILVYYYQFDMGCLFVTNYLKVKPDDDTKENRFCRLLALTYFFN